MKTENHHNVATIRRPLRAPFEGILEACRTVAAKLNELKGRVTQRLAGDAGMAVPEYLLSRAVSEAEALAWAAPYPLLLLPVLAEEKVQDARRWVEHQRRVLGLRA